jgi:hypothetical protein
MSGNTGVKAKRPIPIAAANPARPTLAIADVDSDRCVIDMILDTYIASE